MSMESFIGRFLALFSLFFMGLAGVAKADALAFPLVCEPGQSCWIIGYPDLNPAEGTAQDYACGPSAADGDVFLRLGLADASAIPLNVPVVAIDDGKVVDVSDGLDDRLAASKKQIKMGTSNCGNGVVIKHAGGMESAYCHMRKGSIRVARGDTVRKGDIIGAAGQSGVALWPQLGFSIREGGYFIDPVTGASPAEGCGQRVRPAIALPDEFTHYQPAAIVALGFSTAPIPPAAMALGQAPRFAQMNPGERTINLWGMVLGVHKDDQIEIRLRDPRGRSFYYDRQYADSDYERFPINANRSRGYVNWRTGLYSGTVTITRQVEHRPVSVSREVTLMVE
jgi:hypothetical protein